MLSNKRRLDNCSGDLRPINIFETIEGIKGQKKVQSLHKPNTR